MSPASAARRPRPGARRALLGVAALAALLAGCDRLEPSVASAVDEPPPAPLTRMLTASTQLAAGPGQRACRLAHVDARWWWTPRPAQARALTGSSGEGDDAAAPGPLEGAVVELEGRCVGAARIAPAQLLTVDGEAEAWWALDGLRAQVAAALACEDAAPLTLTRAAAARRALLDAHPAVVIGWRGADGRAQTLGDGPVLVDAPPDGAVLLGWPDLPTPATSPLWLGLRPCAGVAGAPARSADVWVVLALTPLR